MVIELITTVGMKENPLCRDYYCTLLSVDHQLMGATDSSATDTADPIVADAAPATYNHAAVVEYANLNAVTADAITVTDMMQRMLLLLMMLPLLLAVMLLVVVMLRSASPPRSFFCPCCRDTAASEE